MQCSTRPPSAPLPEAAVVFLEDGQEEGLCAIWHLATSEKRQERTLGGSNLWNVEALSHLGDTKCSSRNNYKTSPDQLAGSVRATTRKLPLSKVSRVRRDGCADF